MLPGTTSSESDFLAPRRFPGPGAALFARPWLAWDAERALGGEILREDRRWRIGRCDNDLARREEQFDRLEQGSTVRAEPHIRGWSMVGFELTWRRSYTYSEDIG